MENTYNIELNDYDSIAMGLLTRNDNAWSCGLSERNLKLMLAFEFMNWKEYGMEMPEDNLDNYTYTAETTIMPIMDEIAKSVLQNIADSNDIQLDEVNLLDISQHMGLGVMVNLQSVNPKDFDLKTIRKINGEPSIKVVDNIILIHNDYGMKPFIKDWVIPRSEGIMGLIGFYLDRRTRGIGTTGWNELEAFLGEDIIQNAFNKIAN